MSRYGELSVHRWMLRDTVRNEAYRRALAHAVKPGDVVLDMGAGTGILSIFAAIAGARKVYAVERTRIAEVAHQVIAANGYAETIEIVQADLEDISLDEKVDVIVSEWMGGFGVDENMLAPLVMARDRWLRPGGKIVPGRVTAMLAPAHVPDFDEAVAYWRAGLHGIDLGVIADLTTQETFHTQTEPASLVAPPQVMWSHDPLTCSLAEADQRFTARLAFHATEATTLSGFVSWFAADMGDGSTLTNAVGDPDTHWGRTLFPLARPIHVAAGTQIDIELVCDPSLPGSCEFGWTVTVAGHPTEVHETRPARRIKTTSSRRA